MTSLPHASLNGDVVARSRHASFILHSLGLGLSALVCLPVLLTQAETHSIGVFAALALIAAQASMGLLVSATGWFLLAQMIAAVTLSAAAGLLLQDIGTAAWPVLLLFFVIMGEAILSARLSMMITALAATSFAVFLSGVLADVNAERLTHWGDIARLEPLALLIGGMSFFAIAGQFWRAYGHDQFVSQHIKDQRQQFQSFSEDLPDTVLSLTPDGEVTYASPSAAQALGLSTAQLQGRCFFDRVKISDRPQLLKALAAALDSGTAALDFQLQVGEGTKGLENLRWCELRLMRRGPKTNTLEGPNSRLVGVVRDVEHRRELEALSLEAQKEAEAYARSKTEFLALTTHELRTPLNAILGFSEMLESELHGQFEYKRHREYAGIIHQSGQHLLQLVNEVLDVSRMETGQFEIYRERFEVADLTRSCCNMVAKQASERNVRIALGSLSNLPTLHADPRACRQILLNLLHNAIKFSHPGGAVTLSVSVDEPGAMVFEVADQGVGIASDMLAKIGHPFVQANKSFNRIHQGTGLGLAVVRGLIDLHAGHFEMTSELGKGTTVRVHLPISEADLSGRNQNQGSGQRVVDLSAHRQALSA